MPDRLAKRVLVVGWDAADWKFARPLMDRGLMPTLKSFSERGASGNLATNRPILSPMLWNSIATGKRPFKHGIYGFTEPRPDGDGVRPCASTSRRCKALWNIATQSGLKTNVVGWYASHPAEPINGVAVSNRYTDLAGKIDEPWPLAEGTVHPPELSDELAALRVHPGELGREAILPFMPTLEGNQLDPGNHHRLGHLMELIAETTTVHSAATHLMANTEWDLMCVYYEGIDRFAHGFMEFHPPRMDHVRPGFFEMYKEVMTGCYRFHDMMLAALLQLAGPDTTVILLSDHGYYDDHLRPKGSAAETNPVAWHRPLGLLAMDGPGVRSDTNIFGSSILDITPTVLTLLGLPVDSQMDGRVLLDAIAPDAKPDWVMDWDNVPGDAGLHPDNHRGDPEAERAAMQQLIDLGYIEDPGTDEEAVQKTILGNLNRKMSSFLDADRHEQALSVAEELADRFPNEPYAWLGKALCLIKCGRHDEAKLALSRVDDAGHETDTQTAAQAQKLRAELAFAENDESEVERLTADLPTDPTEALGVYLLRGQLAIRQKNSGKAESAYRGVLGIDDSHAGAHDGLAQAALIREDWEAAAEAALDAIECAFFLPRAHLHLGVALAQLGRHAEAIDALRVALRQYPGLHRAQILLAQLYEQIGQPELARNARLAAAGLGVEKPSDLGMTKPGTAASSQTYGRDSSSTPGPQSPRPPNAQTVFVVSGLPRSGTSLMMQMLQAAGIPVLTDHARQADRSNPRGYFEHQDIKRLNNTNEILKQAAGRAVKVVHALIGQLPPGQDYRVLWMDRDLDEILASQGQMLRDAGKTPSTSRDQLRRTFTEQIRRSHDLMTAREDIYWLSVSHRGLFENATNEACRVAEFVGRPEKVTAMLEVIDPDLYRQRAAEVPVSAETSE